MTRKKGTLLGLAALALVALSAFVISGAQAEGVNNFEFTCIENEAEHKPCTGHGEEAIRHGKESLEPHEFATAFGTITCEEVTFKVTTDADGTSTTAPTEPEYKKCGVKGSTDTVVVHTNECHYEFHVEKEIETTPDEFEGSADIVCPGENDITVTLFDEHTATLKCTIHVLQQTTIKPIRFRNMTEAEPNTDVTVEAVEASTTVKRTPGPGHSLLGGCGAFFQHGNSKYTGNTTVRATDENDEFTLEAEISPAEEHKP